MNDMTNEEAIELLENTSFFGASMNDIDTAIEMAVEALKNRKEGFWYEENPKNSKDCRLIRCSSCNKGAIVSLKVPLEVYAENRNYCDRCGARLRVGGEHEILSEE